MKTGIITVCALAALFTCAPASFAADQAESPAANGDGPTPAQLKARKLKKPIYTKTQEALKAAEACNQPILAFLLIEQNDIKDPNARTSDFIEKKLLTQKVHMTIKKFIQSDDFTHTTPTLMKMKLSLNSA